MTGACLTCGWITDDLQAHHVAGRHNHATLVVPVCVDCHRILTAWQRASGIELDADAPRTEWDKRRARLVGAQHLYTLIAQRHPERTTVGAGLSAHTARALSKILDISGAADRPGRWLPDPTAPMPEAIPVGFPADTELDRFTELAHLLAAIVEILGAEIPLPVHPCTLGALADDPTPLRTALTSTPMGQVLGQLASYVSASHPMILRLLAVGAPERLDDELIAEANVWISTGYRLLREAFELATNGMDELS